MGLNNLVLSLNNVLTGSVLLVALVGAGIWFTLQLKFVQVRGLGKCFKEMFGGLFDKEAKKAAGKDGMSSFQALATAIAAQVGTGNIAGAATAIAVGGPGAIFWMWLSAFLGMATIFSEACMAQKYKQYREDGSVTGGPVYYIRAAFQNKFGKILAGIFAVLITLALGFMGNAVQANSIAASWNTAFHFPKLPMGILLAAMLFYVACGGMERIAKITEKVVPLMALIYIVGALIVIIAFGSHIPMVLHDIVIGAFRPDAIAGGALGATVKLAVTKGVARGLFSNEAGMGSTPHAHAVAKVEHPVQQGFIAMGGVIIDTFIILNLTALVILCTGVRSTGKTGAELSQAGFSALYGKGGEYFIAICMFFFAFSTIIGWYFFGEQNIKYLFGDKAVKAYLIIVCAVIILGSMQEVSLVWNMADCFNSLMVLPNIIGLLFLTKQVKGLHNDYYHNFLPKQELKKAKKN